MLIADQNAYCYLQGKDDDPLQATCAVEDETWAESSDLVYIVIKQLFHPLVTAWRVCIYRFTMKRLTLPN